MAGLTGMKAICEYMNRSEATVLMLISACALPACKLGGGIWESDTELIDKWRKEQISEGIKRLKPPVKKRKRKKIAS